LRPLGFCAHAVGQCLMTQRRLYRASSNAKSALESQMETLTALGQVFDARDKRTRVQRRRNLRRVIMIQGKLCLTSVAGPGRQFVAQSGTGHAFVMDDADGHSGPKPIEFALLALGGCTAFDVISILRKKRQRVTGYEIELRAEQNAEPPAYFTRVEIKHRLRGDIDPEAVQAAIQLSETKYCAVGAMVSKTAKIETTFEILPERTPETLPNAA